MTIDILVPPLSQTSDTLVLIAWLKKVGDPVTKGEALFEVETDKATLEVESPATGTITALLAEPGAEVAVRSVIGAIAAPEAATLPPANGQSVPNTSAPTPPALYPAPHSPLRSRPPTRLFASPRARGLADRAGIALEGIASTGPRGMIVERDVKAFLDQRAAAATVANVPSPSPSITDPALEAQAPATDQATSVTPTGSQAHPPTRSDTPTPSPASRRAPLSPTRRTIARRLQTVQQTTAPVTLTRDTDATELVALRERLLAGLAAKSVRPTYTDFLIAIVARCLLDHPHFNATFDGEALELFDPIHMGLAVDTERGLLVPVLRHVEHKGLAALAAARQQLVQRALAGQSTPEELSGGTFTLTNLGSLGIDAFTPLLNPPQVAILGLGRLRPVALPIGGVVVPRQGLFLSLTFDHRAVDGAPAARFLGDIAALIEHPDRIWL
jgi:pyruvate dehydrogenase E2 component (dihydrolipoamide acetyltransferase)